jgi:hypothetical protein
MNKTMTRAEIESALSVSHVAMTRQEKLLRWAKLVRKSKVQMRLYHLLENETQSELDKLIFYSSTAFELAYEDPILRDAGLDSKTIGGMMTFFAINKEDLHDFSCNCGGPIDNRRMAKRIESIAYRDGKPKSFLAKLNPFG